MAHPLKHAASSARKFGEGAEEYLLIHNRFDESKAFLADFRYRALRHHAEGIFLAEKLFGVAIVNSDGKKVPVRYVGEQGPGRSRAHSHSARLAPADQTTTVDVRPGPGRRNTIQLRDGRYEHPKRSCTERYAPAPNECRMQNIQSYWIFSIGGFPVT